MKLFLVIMENILHLTETIKALTPEEYKNWLTPDSNTFIMNKDEIMHMFFKSFCYDFFTQNLQYINEQLIPKTKKINENLLNIIQSRTTETTHNSSKITKKPSKKSLNKLSNKSSNTTAKPLNIPLNTPLNTPLNNSLTIHLTDKSSNKPLNKPSNKSTKRSKKCNKMMNLPDSLLSKIGSFLRLYDLIQFEMTFKTCFMAIRTSSEFQCISISNMQSLIEYSLMHKTQNHWVRFKYVNTFALKLSTYDYKKFGNLFKFHSLPMIPYIENLVLDLWVENEKMPSMFSHDFALCNFKSVTSLYIDDVSYLVDCGGLSTMMNLEFLQIHYVYPQEILALLKYPPSMKGICLLNGESEQWLSFSNVSFCNTIQSITVPAIDFTKNESEFPNLQELCVEGIKLLPNQEFVSVKRLHLRNCESIDEICTKNLPQIFIAFPNMEHFSLDFSYQNVSNFDQLGTIINVLDTLGSCLDMMYKDYIRITLWIHTLPRDLLIHSFFMIIDSLLRGNITQFQFDIVYFCANDNDNNDGGGSNGISNGVSNGGSNGSNGSIGHNGHNGGNGNGNLSNHSGIHNGNQLSAPYQRIFKETTCQTFTTRLNHDFSQLSITNAKSIQIDPWIYDYSKFFDIKYALYDILSIHKGFSGWTMC